MAEAEPTRVRSNSNEQGGDPWHHPANHLSLSASGQTATTPSDGSERLDEEVPTPPLALISSRVKSVGALESCASFGTATVRYSYETTTLSRLLKAVGERLRGRKALSVALVVHGSPGCFKLCSQKTVTCATLREDDELRKFLETLVTSYLNSHSQYARIDILNCPVAQNVEGEQLIRDMEALLGVAVSAYSDIQGAQISEAGSTETGRCSRIGTLYFDNEKLKDWSASSHQTMALFERIRTIGKGAYGAAVLYRRKDDGSHVILKEINLMDLTKTERHSAMNETQILSRVDHPNIISYYDNFEEDGVLMIEMEYADGGTLAQFLQKQMNQNRTLLEKDVVTMFSQMVDALKYLHDHNILHRDLKTANVFLTKEGIVKLGDFGISKILSATSPEANTVLGTPYYISPEICEGKHYDAKSDIWALGCILYEMVCLRRTFEGTNLPVLVHKIVEVSFAPVKGDYSDILKHLITDMLRKNPEERPSAKDIFTNSIPQLASQFASTLCEEEEEEETAKTHTKSLLYYLDGVSMLLYHVPETIQTRLDHIAIGYSHALVLADEGMVFSWGVGSRGQLGHGDRETRRKPLLVEAVKGKRIVRVECGGEFSVLVTDNGILMTCGRGDHGVQGHHDNQDCLKPKLVEDLIAHDVVQVGCGQSHVAVVTSENRVLVWGAGQHGQLGTGDEEDRNHPVEVAVHSPGSKMAEVICNVKCGLDGTMMLTDNGRLFACGSNQDNKLGLNRRETFIMQMRKILNKDRQLQVTAMSLPTPLKELGKHRVVDMSLGPTHSTVLTELGRVFTFGRNSEGQLCSGNTQPQNTPVPVRNCHTTPTMVTSSELCTIVTTDDNSFLVWGSRPVIKSPIIEVLEHSNTPKKIPPLNKCTSGDNVFSDADPNSGPGTPNTKRCLSQCQSLEPQNPQNSDPSDIPIPSSGEASPTKGSANDIVAKGLSPQQSSSRDSAPFLSRATARSGRNPSLDFSDSPHSLVPCSDCELYLRTLTEVVTDLLDVSLTTVRGGKSQSLKRESTSGSQLGTGRRATSNSSVHTTGSGREASVILQPTFIDLVGRSGILNLLSVEGITEAKLEGLSCYGSNVLVLIQAQVVVGTTGSETGERDSEKRVTGKTVRELPTFKIGRRVIQRTQWKRSSPFQPPPSLHTSFPPPLHPLTSPPPQPHHITSPADSTSEDSMVETWIREAYEEAKGESEREKGDSEKQTVVTEAVKQAETTCGDVARASSSQVRTEAWKTSPRVKSESQTLVESRASGVKPETPSGSQGVKQQATESPKPQESAPLLAKKMSLTSGRKTQVDAGLSAVEKPTNQQFLPQKQQKVQPHAPRSLKQAASTTNVSGERPNAERKSHLNVKRVSSSNDVNRASASPRSSNLRVSTATHRSPGTLGARKLSDNPRGKERGGEVVRENDSTKQKPHRLSLPSERIRLPSQKGERGLPTPPQETAENGRAVLQRQSAVEKLSSESSKLKTTSAKHRSLLESSPYAEPVPRISRPGSKPLASVKSRSPASARLISASDRNLDRKKVDERKHGVEAGSEAEEKLRASQEREQEMKEHIEKLQSQLQKQQSQIESNENAMKELNQKLQEIQQERSSGTERRRRIGSALFGQSQVSPSSNSAEETPDGGKQSKSRFCAVM